MEKRKLTITEVEELIRKNRYYVEERNWFLSRCIDGRYQEENQKSKIKNQNLEPLAKPGADVGDLMMTFVARREYGLEIADEKIFRAVLKTVDGWKNFRFHKGSLPINQLSELESGLGSCFTRRNFEFMR